MVNLDYLYNPAAAKNAFARDFFLDKKSGFSVIENGTILPHKDIMVDGKWTWGSGGIIDSEGEFIKSSHVFSGAGKSYNPSPTAIIHSSKTVIYLGIFCPVWGHAITDNIRRLWFLKSDEFQNQFKDCPIVYINWATSPLKGQKNFRRLLKILDVDFDRLQAVDCPTRFEKIILPDESFFLTNTGRYFTAKYRETIERIRDFALKNRTPTSAKKIYYFYGARQVGEERLAEYFKSKGYETISPEKLTLEEQLNLLINTESFASTLGSCAHNSVFLRDGTEAILIPRSVNSFTGYQQILEQVHEINSYYVDSTMSVFNVRHDLHCFLLSEQLKSFFGDKFDADDENEKFKVFLQYFGLAAAKGRTINQSLVQTYGTVFSSFMERLKKREDLITAYALPPDCDVFRPLLSYQTHVHKNSWCAWKYENQISNSLDQKLDIQAIKINSSIHKVYYAVYYGDAEDWSAEVAAPEPAGTIGKSKSIFGVRIRLDEAGTKNFDILYRVHKFDGKWTPWAKNGETLYSHGVKLNAIQIKLEPKT